MKQIRHVFFGSMPHAHRRSQDYSLPREKGVLLRTIYSNSGRGQNHSTQTDSTASDDLEQRSFDQL